MDNEVMYNRICFYFNDWTNNNKNTNQEFMHDRINTNFKNTFNEESGYSLIQANFIESYSVMAYKTGVRYSVCLNNKKVAEIIGDTIEIDGVTLTTRRAENRLDFVWEFPDGCVGTLKRSKRYMIFDNGRPIWISHHNTTLDKIKSLIVDRQVLKGDEFCELYFENTINPLYVICVLIVALFESTPS